MSLTGRTLSHYVLGEEISRGGMGVVYRATHTHLLAGHAAQATDRFRKIADGGYMRLFSPVEYVRSLYLLGQIAERQGDRAMAREYYARFLRYWKDGDMDRERVQDAMKKLAQPS